MSDWTAPGGSGPRPEDRPQPRYGELAPEGWTPPQPVGDPFGVPGDPGTGGTPGGWAPPPKPGLLPLRPLSLGDILAAAFQVIRRNPRPTFGFSLVVNVITTLVVGGVTAGVGFALFRRVDMASLEDSDAITAGSVLVFALSVLASSLLSGALMGVIQGVVALEVAHGALGERLTLRSLWAATLGRRWALVGWTLLESLAAIVAVGIAVGAFAVFVPLGAVGEIVGGVAAFLVGAGLAVLLTWLGIKVLFVPSLIVIERLPIGAAIRRSWSLTRANWWRTFGVNLLVFVIVTAAAQIVSTPVSLIGGVIGGLVNPNGTADVEYGAFIGSAIASAVIGIVVNAVVLVAQSAVPAVQYLDTRMRREGLDLVLQHHVEEAAAGRPVGDPYRSPDGSAG